MSDLRKEKKSTRFQFTKIGLIFCAIAFFNLSACALENRGNLRRLKTNMEEELRRSWKDYMVFYRGTAFVYKIRDDKKIILDDRWVEVTSEEQMAKSKIWEATNSAEILGLNDALFGYVVYRYKDGVSIKIIDENTVQLHYNYVRTYGGR